MGWLRNFIFGVDPAHDDAGLSKQVRDWGAEKNNDMSPQSDDAVDSEKGQEKEGLLLQYFGFVGLGLVWTRLLLLNNYGPTGDSGQIGHSH